MSIRKRIQILLLALVGVPLALLLLESYRAGRRAIVAEMKEGSLQIARLEAAEVNLIFDPPRVLVEELKLAVEAQPELHRDALRGLLRASLERNPDLYGLALALEPSATPLGRFAPYVHRRGGAVQGADLEYTYTTYDWYRLPAQGGEARWIGPYFGPGGQAVMVTYSAPIRRDGRIVGVVEADLDLDGLVHRLRGIRPAGGGAVYLVDRDGHVVAHPDLDAVARLGGSAELGAVGELMRRAGQDTVDGVDPISHARAWLVETPIAALSEARGGTDWSLVVSWPRERRLAPLGELARRMVVLYAALGGAALLFLHRSIEATLTRPLRRLSEQARRYARGEYAPGPLRRDDPAEVREVGLALDALGESLAASSSPRGARRHEAR